jgi:hypothetical protein
MTKKMTKIVELEDYSGSKSFFVAVSARAFVECREDNKRFYIYNRGEVEIAKSFAKEFPDKEIRVSMGPWRSYDIAGRVSEDQKIIFIDIYSVRCPSPTGRYVTDLITNAHKIFAGKTLTPEQRGDNRFARLNKYEPLADR